MISKWVGALLSTGLAVAVGCSVVNSYDDLTPQDGTGAGKQTSTQTGSSTSSGTGGAPTCSQPEPCDSCKDGACCAEQCNLCNCELGCKCFFECKLGSCDTECKGSGTECHAPCHKSSTPAVNAACTCRDGATCMFTCTEVDCTVKCEEDAKCILYCGDLTAGTGGAGNCSFYECAAGEATLCPGSNAWACNTPCPS